MFTGVLAMVMLCNNLSTAKNEGVDHGQLRTEMIALI